MPVCDTENSKRGNETCQLEHPPKRLERILALQFLENSLRVLTKEAAKGVFQRMLRFTIVAVLVDRNPIDRVAVLVGPVGVSFVMLHVNALVEIWPNPTVIDSMTLNNRFNSAERKYGL